MRWDLGGSPLLLASPRYSDGGRPPHASLRNFLKHPPGAARVPGSLILNIKKVAQGAMKTSSHIHDHNATGTPSQISKSMCCLSFTGAISTD
jgi:hypothetical protein